MSWYFLTFAADEAATGKRLSLKEEFERCFAAARGPREMALFQRTRDDGGVELFFTPDCGRYASELLEQWGCTPCERPSLVGLQLLVGHSEITYYMP